MGLRAESQVVSSFVNTTVTHGHDTTSNALMDDVVILNKNVVIV